MTVPELSQFEATADKRAHHRALILKILKAYPNLTVQQIMAKELDFYGYTFLTDNRLRELRKLGLVESVKGSDGLQRWSKTP